MIVALENPIRSYDWGSITALPELLGVRPTGRPQSELWVGAHPGSPSRVVGGADLDAYLATDPRTLLGPATTERFGARLPYLVKILAVERPLSIQVHPTIAQAEAGYAADDSALIPLSAPHRRYRDRGHKPEMVVAVTPFEALLGFADPAGTAAMLTGFALPGLAPVVEALAAGSLRGAVETILGLPPDDAAALAGQVTRVAATAAADTDEGPFDLVAKLAVDYPADRGILLALLMEHVYLEPGDAAFVPAGVPHAYLHGMAVEPQASSDNTLRAGLTAKHVDVDEVAKILRYEAGGVVRVTARSTGRPGGEAVYPVPVDEFVLTRWNLATEAAPARIGDGRAAPWVVLVLSGSAEVRAEAGAVTLGPGQAAFVPAADAVSVPTLQGTGTVFGVTTAEA